MFRLASHSSDEWLQAVLADFDAFLVDHAACERKAAASALAFVVRYPDRPQLHAPSIELAREELEHFQRVLEIIHARGIPLGPDQKDPYVGALLQELRVGRDARLLDRLLIFAVVEGRGCERFGLIGEHLADPELSQFYRELAQSESRHHGLFLGLAREAFERDAVDQRLDELLAREAEIVRDLPARAALH